MLSSSSRRSARANSRPLFSLERKRDAHAAILHALLWMLMFSFSGTLTHAQVRYYRPGTASPSFHRPQENARRYSSRFRRSQPIPQQPTSKMVLGRPLIPSQLQSQLRRQTDQNPATARTASPPIGVNHRNTQPSRHPRIAGDFEKQKAILISVCELLPAHENILVQLVNACEAHVTVGLLVNDRKQLIQATKLLMRQNRPYPHIKFYHLELDTIWLRDFGPRFGELENGRAILFDFIYEGTRPHDEKMPKAWARLTGDRYHAVPWTIQGGNLLFNGQGLALTTERIFDDNQVHIDTPVPGADPESERRLLVTDELKTNCNLDELVVLEPLRNEATRHVDMFTAFVAPDHVVVTALDRSADPVNAALLDRNAEKLKQIIVDGKPLKVTRIPTPAREGKSWTTFTNVILANDLLLLPVFDDTPSHAVERAVAIYQSALPGHTIKTIDTTTLKKLEGSVHCMSINVPQFAPLPPNYLSLKKTIAFLNRAQNENVIELDAVGVRAVTTPANETSIRE